MFSSAGRRWVLKEAKLSSEVFEFLDRDPFEAVKILRKMYSIVKKYYEKELLETDFLVAVGHGGFPTVVAVQPEIVGGRLLMQIIQTCDGRQVLTVNEKLDEFRRRWQKVIHDREWKKLPKRVRDRYADDDFSSNNAFLTMDRGYVIIDF